MGLFPCKRQDSKCMSQVNFGITEMEISPEDSSTSNSTVSPQDFALSREDVENDSVEGRDVKGEEGNRSQPESTSQSGGVSRQRRDSVSLPARQVFPIQIGAKPFRLSGASISSDAPSYLTYFFERQLRSSDDSKVETLYIDRDPATFEDIALHLQGYHIQPRNAPHFVKLFADAQFFSLPRLTAQLCSSPMFVRIGDQDFQIPQDLFSNPGDTPNYFSLLSTVFFSAPSEIIQDRSQQSALRPPKILLPTIPNRSETTFADLLHILRGYPLHIRSKEHRLELLRDARYFHLKALEQRLIPHEISYNLARRHHEIVILLQDIQSSGVSVLADGAASQSLAVSPKDTRHINHPAQPGWVQYQRPYVDSEPYNLIVNFDEDQSTYLALTPTSWPTTARVGRATFFRQTLAHVSALLAAIAKRMQRVETPTGGDSPIGAAKPPPGAENASVMDDKVNVRIGADADVTLDGKPWYMDHETADSSDEEMSGNLASSSGTSKEVGALDWIVKNAQWRIRVRQIAETEQTRSKAGIEVVLAAVKIEAYSSERARNAQRAFLT